MVHVNEEAERTILGAAMIDNAAFHYASNIVSAEDFFSVLNRQIFKAMATLAMQNKPIDPVTVKGRLVDSNFAAADIASYLSDLMAGLPRVRNVEEWANIVKDKATLRRLEDAADEIRVMIGDAAGAEAAVDAALEAVLKVSEGAQRTGGFVSPAEAVKSATAAIDVMVSAKDGVSGLHTGFPDYDTQTGGMKPHQLLIFAGRPGMGKSAAAVCIGDNVAQAGGRVAFFSMEMSRDELTMRRISKRSGFPVRNLSYDETGFAKVAGAYGGLAEDPFFIDDTPALTVAQIRSRARRLAAERGGLDLVIVDYLQLIRGERFENRQQEIATIARDLKNLAKELNVPLIALSQLSRKVEERENKRPILSDLRESGELEQAADIVTFLYRHAEYDRSADPNEAEWITAKQRNGSKFTSMLRYEPELTAFYEDGLEPWKRRKQ